MANHFRILIQTPTDHSRYATGSRLPVTACIHFPSVAESLRKPREVLVELIDDQGQTFDRLSLMANQLTFVPHGLALVQPVKPYAVVFASFTLGQDATAVVGVRVSIDPAGGEPVDPAVRPIQVVPRAVNPASGPFDPGGPKNLKKVAFVQPDPAVTLRAGQSVPVAGNQTRVSQRQYFCLLLFSEAFQAIVDATRGEVTARLVPSGEARFALNMTLAAGPSGSTSGQRFVCQVFDKETGQLVEWGDRTVQVRTPGVRTSSPAAAHALAGPHIDLNTASFDELEPLPAIGPVLAQRIIDARPFASLDDLLKIERIGPATLARIRELVSVGNAPAVRGGSGVVKKTAKRPKRR